MQRGTTVPLVLRLTLSSPAQLVHSAAVLICTPRLSALLVMLAIIAPQDLLFKPLVRLARMPLTPILVLLQAVWLVLLGTTVKTVLLPHLSVAWVCTQTTVPVHALSVPEALTAAQIQPATPL